eukprot:CAMPEP_0201515026 /NCGR_PEP_ID=MMETSP0161_2-20130828/6702_1 /ASSEMBLY_ACC=CAM_ASM_000251 /TAXON_ID=180227 /ORGANISM="Neoparamoeba aestuarina, Strain SoJaBio B1-5/56/2" /LENGTH=263 /DNA_ID=CAMNT_0047911729 /DNA_START=63 /DNA_END=851 /DNA_ORIENTATION=-
MGEIPPKGNYVIRGWLDGCWDVTHYGHVNAFRQARSMCDELIVGIHPDSEILEHKGKQPIQTQSERHAVVASCRWVDYVVLNAPYRTSAEVLQRYQADLAFHGDDLTLIASGENSYQSIIDIKAMRYFPRTRGVSTTGITEWIRYGRATYEQESVAAQILDECVSQCAVRLHSGRLSAVPSRTKAGVVGILNASWDILSGPRVHLISAVKSMVDVLIVVVVDETNSILTATERCISLAGCRYVDCIVFRPESFSELCRSHFVD